MLWVLCGALVGFQNDPIGEPERIFSLAFRRSGTTVYHAIVTTQRHFWKHIYVQKERGREVYVGVCVSKLCPATLSYAPGESVLLDLEGSGSDHNHYSFFLSPLLY